MSIPVGGLGRDLGQYNSENNKIFSFSSRELLFDLPSDIAFLVDYGVEYQTLHDARQRSIQFRVPAHSVLIKYAVLTEKQYFQCLAHFVGLEFTDETVSLDEPLFSAPAPETLDRMTRMVWVSHEFNAEGLNYIHLAPDGMKLVELKAYLDQHPYLRNRLRVTTPSSNRRCLEQRSAPSLLRNAIDGLRDRFPAFSARRVISVPQAITLLLLLQLLVIFSLSNVHLVVLALHLTANFFFIGCTSLRLFASIHVPRTSASEYIPQLTVDHVSDHQLPMYSVLIPVFREAGQIRDLVDAMLKLEWPRERLEIMILCEADDKATILAAKQILRERNITGGVVKVVEVPVSKPRTKPKALNYALPLCRGEVLVIYDAEDRPHPLQLREAHQRFLKGPQNLACLQAPLIIHNHKDGWLTRLFAIEYSSLFDGLLPMLAERKAPLPLGGTSNHFKRAVLDKIGAWDPYNVTEDADLGVRIARAGYQIGTLRYPTFEKAPTNLNVWLKQRTRWFKGWYQTFLVHMRNPLGLVKDLGWSGVFFFHLMVTGMAVSALVHPIIIYFLLSSWLEIRSQGMEAIVKHPLLMLDLFTIVIGYMSFVILAIRTLKLRNLSDLRWQLIAVPIYWVMLSAAAWRALWHLVVKPHECGLR